MKQYQVSFVPVNDNLRTTPPIIAGELDSVWVDAKSEKHAPKQAEHKMRTCYGVEIKDAEVLG